MTKEQQFNEALLLLGKFPNKQSLRFYNRAGYSPQRLDAILYDLKKAASINDQELLQAKSAPEPKEQKAQIEKKVAVIGTGNSLAEKTQKALQESEQAAGGFKLVVLYPFIENEDCPDELKALVTDMMTAYRAFIKGQEELSVILYGDEEKGIEPQDLDNDQLYALGGDLVKNWELNELINEELSYYGETGEILGKHPKLQQLALVNETAKKSNKKLSDRVKQLNKNLINNKKKLKSAKDEKKKAEIQLRLDQYKNELEVVQAEIGKRAADEEE